MSTKNRDLSTYELFVVLQEEYYLAYLRHRIYPSVKTKVYYEKIKGYKRDKIEDIAVKNGLPSIFSDKDEDLKVRQRVLGTTGFPEIRYRDDTDRDEKEFTDKTNYYLPGSEVRVDSDDGVFVGTVVKFNLVSDTVLVKKIGGEGESRDWPITKVWRIL